MFKQFVFALGLLLLPVSALAQSTASEVVPGYLTTSGCTPVTATPCFVQFGAQVSGPAATVTVLAGSTTTVTQATASSLNTTATPLSSTATSSSALSANQVVVASAGKLVSFEVSADSTLSGAAWWVMIYDATSAPTDGAVTPKKCYAQASGTTSVKDTFNSPVTFGTGITIGVSTAGCFTKAASAHAFISGDYQ